MLIAYYLIQAVFTIVFFIVWQDQAQKEYWKDKKPRRGTEPADEGLTYLSAAFLVSFVWPIALPIIFYRMKKGI